MIVFYTLDVEKNVTTSVCKSPIDLERITDQL
jgi:hypothetical protein